MPKDLDDLLKYDALQEAEDIAYGKAGDDRSEYYSGRSDLKNDLFMLFSSLNQKDKREALKDQEDTGGSQKVTYFQKVLSDNGFILDLHEVGKKPSWDKTFHQKMKNEMCQVWYHPDGIVVIFDTFMGSVNSAKCYYQVKPKDPEIKNFYECISSGGFEETDQGLIWVGDHDAREGLIHNLNKIRNHGTFLKQWYRTYRLPWFVIWEGPEGWSPDFDYDAASLERILRCPNVSQIMGFSVDEGKTDSQSEESKYSESTACNIQKESEKEIPVSQPIELTNELIEKRAYHLWEDAGCPNGRSEEFWNAAIQQLVPRTWYVSCGDLKVSGYGTFDEVLELSMQKADDDGMSLAENINVSATGFDVCPYQKNTLFVLRNFGLWF